MLRQQALFEIKRKNTLSSVAIMRKLLDKTLQMLNIKNALKNKMLLAFTEAANNIVEHSNPSAQYLKLQLFRLPECWQISLSDNGGFFDLATHVNDITHINENSENGRGLALIKSLCCDQHYQTVEGGNQLDLVWLRQHKQKPTVLIVEDELSQRKIMSAYLGHDYNVKEASNGQQALKFIQQKSIDVVIADIQMPIMNGVELLEHLNADESQTLIPFIFLTGSEDPDILDRINYLGIDSVLHKPINKLQLQRCIQQVQARHRQLKTKLNAQIEQRLSALLKPNLPTHIPPYEFAWKQLNAQGGGGDFLLCHPTPHDKGVIIVLGDLMGHDSTSKFFAHTYVSYIRGLLLSLLNNTTQDEHIDIGNMMAHINHFSIHDNIASQSLMTCQIAYVTEDKIDIVSAGHPAPFLVNSTQSCMQIDTQGIALGILDEVSYPVKTIKLNKNERLVFYTDGLFESVNNINDIPNLVDNVQQAMVKSYAKPLTTAIDQIIQSFSSVAGLPVKDDTLLLVIGR